MPDETLARDIFLRRDAARAKAYYAENKEKIQQRRRSKRLQQKGHIRPYRYQDGKSDWQRWREKNKGAYRASVQKRVAAKLKATPPWLTEEHRKQMVKVYEEAVRLCAATGIKHHVDHIIPLLGKNVCGLHVPWNLQAIPATDNMKKGNRF